MVWTRRPEILLCPNIPKPLHGLVPRVILGSKWWNETRYKAYMSTNYRCQACGVRKEKAKFHAWLEGHELYNTDYRRGRLTYLETVPLCNACHNFIHDGRLRWLLSEGKITHGRFRAVIAHGDRVLEEAGLVRESYEERDRAILLGNTVPWGDWRLVLFGKEYPPLYKDYAAWERRNSVDFD